MANGRGQRKDRNHASSKSSLARKQQAHEKQQPRTRQQERINDDIDDVDDTGQQLRRLSADAQATQLRNIQQRVLDAFASAYSDVLCSADRDAVQQEIKAALFRRDFGAVFSDEHADDAHHSQLMLEAYAARWSPSRALCYADVLRRVADSWLTATSAVHITAVGGTPAELAAAALFVVASMTAQLAPPAKNPNAGANYLMLQPRRARLTLIDAAPWAAAVEKLHRTLTTTPEPSPYASAAVKARIAARGPFLAQSAPRPSLPTDFACVASHVNTTEEHGDSNELLKHRFCHADILKVTEDELVAMLGLRDCAAKGNSTLSPSPSLPSLSQPAIVTLFFTLNELYTVAGVGPVTAFLLRLSNVVVPGTLLLVVDSPGSYSETAVGKKTVSSTSVTMGGDEATATQQQDQRRKYPIHWLLEHTLLRTVAEMYRSTENSGCSNTHKWEKLESHESIWFRLDKTLVYPIKLEDMRYQMHVYRAC